MGLLGTEKYLLSVYEEEESVTGLFMRRPMSIHLLLREDAGDWDIIRGLLHAHYVQQLNALELLKRSTSSGKYLLYRCCPSIITDRLFKHKLRFRHDLISQSYSLLTSNRCGSMSLMDTFIHKLRQSSTSANEDLVTQNEWSDKWMIESFILEKNSNRVSVGMEESEKV